MPKSQGAGTPVVAVVVVVAAGVRSQHATACHITTDSLVMQNTSLVVAQTAFGSTHKQQDSLMKQQLHTTCIATHLHQLPAVRVLRSALATPAYQRAQAAPRAPTPPRGLAAGPAKKDDFKLAQDSCV